MEVPDFDLKKQKIATLKNFGYKSAKKSKNNHKSRAEKNLDSIENL